MERITQMKKIVLDTSVIVKWFSVDEDDAEHANKLRRQILGDPIDSAYTTVSKAIKEEENQN